MAGTEADAARQRELFARVSTKLMRASTVMTQSKAAAVEPYGLSLTQYVAMLWLRCNPGTSGAQVARWCGVSPQATSVMLSGLEDRGLVVRVPSSVHSKVLEVSLTRSGATLLGKADKAASSVEKLYAAALTDAELDQLRVLLDRCTEIL